MAAKAAQKAKYHPIIRVDRDVNRTYCWKVQVRSKNQVFGRNFSDGTYGGKRKSLQAAITWRDTMLTEVQTTDENSMLDHLCRVDRGGKKYSWEVQIQSRERIARRCFHDEDYGDEDKARQAAMAWRDAVLAVANYDRWLRNVTTVKSNNQSGFVGVGRSISREIVAGNEVARPYWYAAWHDRRNGKRFRRKFFVSKYGETGAQSLAIATRSRGIAEVLAAEERSLGLDDPRLLPHNMAIPGQQIARRRTVGVAQLSAPRRG